MLVFFSGKRVCWDVSQDIPHKVLHPKQRWPHKDWQPRMTAASSFVVYCRPPTAFRDAASKHTVMDNFSSFIVHICKWQGGLCLALFVVTTQEGWMLWTFSPLDLLANLWKTYWLQLRWQIPSGKSLASLRACLIYRQGVYLKSRTWRRGILESAVNPFVNCLTPTSERCD